MATVDANVWVAAFDTTDVFHQPSSAFLAEAAGRGIRLYGPTSMLVEVACVVARRFRDPALGVRAADGVAAQGLVEIVPLDDALASLAIRLGSQRFLRGADALYAATAQLTGASLISWDNDLIQRSGALSPTDWLNANP